MALGVTSQEAGFPVGVLRDYGPDWAEMEWGEVVRMAKVPPGMAKPRGRYYNQKKKSSRIFKMESGALLWEWECQWAPAISWHEWLTEYEREERAPVMRLTSCDKMIAERGAE